MTVHLLPKGTRALTHVLSTLKIGFHALLFSRYTSACARLTASCASNNSSSSFLWIAFRELYAYKTSPFCKTSLRLLCLAALPVPLLWYAEDHLVLVHRYGLALNFLESAIATNIEKMEIKVLNPTDWLAVSVFEL